MYVSAILPKCRKALRTVTDTLGRVITVNYDAGLYPTSITQTWKDGNGAGSNVTHTWAGAITGTGRKLAGEGQRA